MVYNNDQLDHIINPEGITRKSSAGFVYYYAKRDHIGSTRVLCYENQGTMTSVQTTDYYPFGLTFHNSSTNYNRYLFSGKEIQDQTLNGEKLNIYDFGARNYDPTLGRWFNIDPHAERYTNWSPYVYCYNNPINVVDFNGKDGIYIAFPKYKANGYPFTGHAGVLLIDNKTGYTKYYEYGRYDNAGKGLVRTYPVSNVQMENGMPTTKSLNNVLRQISNASGKGDILEGAYIQSDNLIQ